MFVLCRNILLAITLLFSATNVLAQNVWRVDKTAPTVLTPTGLTWDRAFITIPEAVAAAVAGGGGQIWVADGTYTGLTVMESSIELYGGFEGWNGAQETSLSQRDWNANITKLDGENTTRCLVLVSTVNTRIDGFSITRGRANGSTYPGNVGGGVYYDGADTSNILINCIIEANLADNGNTISGGHGGGIGCYNASPTITDCIIRNNQCDTASYGGGMVAIGASAPTVTNCIFALNRGGAGGAVAATQGGEVSIYNCTVVNNDATGDSGSGGAMATRGTGSKITCTNVIIANHADKAVYEYSDGTERSFFINCLFYNNTGGLFQRGSGRKYYDAEIAQLDEDDPYWMDNLTGDPDFIDAASGDYRITPYSVAFNSGADLSHLGVVDDFLGTARPQFSGYDIGAYEPAPASTGGPVMVVAPRSIDFGDQLVNQGPTATMTVNIYNTGASQMILSAYNTTNTLEGDYTFTDNIGNLSVIIASGDNKRVDVTFDAKKTGARGALMGFTSDDPTTPTVVVPITGNGTNTRPEAGEVLPNYALNFDALNDHVDCGGNTFFQISPEITIEAWIRADAWRTNIWEGTIVSKDQNNADAGYALRCGDNGKLSFVISNASGGWREAATSSLMSAGTWHHVVGMYDGDTIRVFIDGVEEASADDGAGPGITASTTPLYIGNSPEYTDRVFDGYIDEVRIWNTTRTVQQIQDNMYDRLNGNESGLVGYWCLDEGAGSSALDGTSNGNDGVLTNGPGWVYPTDSPIAQLTDSFLSTTDISQDVVIDLHGYDYDGDTLTAALTHVPASDKALIYQYDSGAPDYHGALIDSVPTQVTDSGRRIVFAPQAVATGPTTYTASVTWNVDDGLVTSDNTATHTVTVDRRLDVNFVLDGTLGASLSGDTAQTVAYGDDCTTVTAHAPANYHFASWSEGGVDVGTTNPLQLKNVTASMTLIADFALDQYTLAYTAGTNGTIDGASSQSQTVVRGSDGSAVEALPSMGYHFFQWSDGSTTNPRTDANVTTDVAVTALFEPDVYDLVFQTDGTPGASLNGPTTQTVGYGDDATTVTAVAPTGWVFLDWRYPDSSLCTGMASVRLREVTEATTLTARFEQRTLTLSYVAGLHGSLVGDVSQAVPYGSDGSAVTAQPDTGWWFIVWSDGSSANPRIDTNVTTNVDVIAYFEIHQYTLTYAAGVGGSISGTSPQTVNHGSDGSQVEAVSETGYHFVDWSDGRTDNPRTDASVTTDVAVTANFALNSYQLAFVTDGTTSATIDGPTSQTVTHGSDATTVTAVAPDGWRFYKWMEDGADLTTRSVLRVLDVDGSSTFTAHFMAAGTPSVVISYPAGDISVPGSQDAITFTGTATSGDAGIEVVGYRLNEADWRRADGTESWSFTVALLQGETTVRVAARDLDGHVSPVERVVVTRGAPDATAAGSWVLYR